MAEGGSTSKFRLPTSGSTGSSVVTCVASRSIELPDGVLTLRSPALSDGPAWSAARLANRAWLERAFPAWGSNWEAEQSEVAWVQRWARLRRLARTGRALPFVMTLDGDLIGEIGIDAVDTVSGSGEASVWMVRSHGSPAVMGAATVMVMEQAFTGVHPMNRLLSPVATTSRQGRSPGLRAAGFDIEATVPRRTGAAGLVDHDIWVVHNTAANRDTVAAALQTFGSTSTPARASASRLPRSMVVAAGRAAVREARDGLRAVPTRVSHRLARTSPRPGVDQPGATTSRRPANRRDLAAVDAHHRIPRSATTEAVENEGRLAAVIGHHTDLGTGTTDVFVAVSPGTSRLVLARALRAAVDEVRPTAAEQRIALVRVPADAPADTAPSVELLSDLGLQRVASYGGSPDGSRDWGGEDVWRIPASR